MTRKKLSLVWCTLVLVLTGAPTLVSCQKSAAEHSAPAPAKTVPPSVVQVRTAPVQERKMPRYLRLTGQLTAWQDADVASDTTGKVAETPVERGAVVKAGDVLVKLDDRQASLALAEAKANVELAKSKLVLAESELARNQPLAKARAIAEADFQRLKTDRDARAADLAGAEARLGMAEKSLADATIRAPFAGLVAERIVSAGEYVRADSPVARVVEVDRLRLELAVPEGDVSRVQQGQAVEFSVATFPGQSFAAAIKFIGAAIREASRDLLVEAEVANADGKLKPGLFAEARLKLGEETGLSVPAEAVRIEGPRRKVFVVEKGQVSERLVEAGEANAGFVEIRRGVAKDEAVALAPGPEVVDGAAVQAKP